MCVIFSTTLSKTFLVLRNIQQDIITFVQMSLRKVHVVLDFN